jgi:hypothetical protein
MVCDPMTFSCVLQPCQESSECPLHHVCKPEGCLPQKCACDIDCSDGGFCIQGLCRKEPGSCQQPIVCGRPMIVERALVQAPLARGGVWG